MAFGLEVGVEALGPSQAVLSLVSLLWRRGLGPSPIAGPGPQGPGAAPGRQVQGGGPAT